MSKRNQRSSSSSSTQSRPSPKRNKLLGETAEGNTESCSMDKTPDDRPSLERIMEKLSYLDNRIEDHFGGLKSDISILRHELKEEIEGVKSTLTGVEKSLESAWNVIEDLQAESKSHVDFKKTYQSSLDNVKSELAMASSKNAKLETEIDALKVRFLEEQEKVIALENYSRRENLRFMNVPEQEGENCANIIYDIIENELNMDVENLQFHAIHRVGKLRFRRMRHRKLTQGMLTSYETSKPMSIWFSHWLSRLSKTKEWLQEQEELRLQGEKIDRPNTKWVFEGTVFVDLKVILDRQPLQIGLGRLPDWLRNKREAISLDTFNDSLCVFRCWLFIKEHIPGIISEEPEN